jgi:hypothetical protein
MTDTKGFWQHKGLPDLGNFTAVPTYFTKELMMVGIGIPANFWKFTSIAWRNWIAPAQNGTYPYEFLFTKEQLASEYGIHGDMAAWCMAAYSISGVCKLEKGRRHRFDSPGIPSTLKYFKASTKDDWRAFIGALKAQVREDKKNHWAGHDDGFCVSLAWKIARTRQELGLKDMHSEWLKKMQAAGVITETGVHRIPSKGTGLTSESAHELTSA